MVNIIDLMVTSGSSRFARILEQSNNSAREYDMFQYLPTKLTDFFIPCSIRME